MDEKNRPKNKKLAFIRLAYYLKPHLGAVFFGVVSNLGVGLIALIPPLIYGSLMDRIILNNSIPWSARLSKVPLYVLGLLACYGSIQLSVYIRSFVMHVLGEKVILKLRQEIYHKLQQLSVSFYDSRQTGEIMSRVTNDTEVVEAFVNHAADTLISDMMRLIGMIVVMLWISPTLAVVALVPVPIIFVLAWSFARKIRPLYRSIRERLAMINAKVQENISGVRVVKAFAREDYEYENFDREVTDYYKTRVDTVRKWTKFFPTIDFIVKAGEISIWVTAIILISRGQATVGTLVIFGQYVGMLYQPVGSLARINDTIQRSLAAAERIFEILDEEPKIKDAENAIELENVQGRVEFDHVDFSYDNSDEVLKDICIKAEPGQIIALVGKSGAGKTSIVNLIPRFYDTDRGRVLIDGIDVRQIKQKSLRRNVAMVLQDTFLFNGTIKENIRYGKLDATDEEIIEAAKTANAHEFIEQLPNGYDTEIGERGVKLSGGQKQRVAIARAILADPKILILDEATSSVDSESEYLIHRAMDRLMEGRTTFVIAHRLSTVKHADQIITLEHGRVSEVGDHKSLLSRDGVYSQMYAMQFRLDEELG